MASRHILLVEDEPHLAFTLDYNLSEAGYSVTVVHDGLEAIEKLSSQGPYDLVILDVMLPSVNGYKIAEFIRRSDHQTQILMLTAKAGEKDIIKGLEKGVDDYITKPFKLDELMLRVRRMIERSSFFLKDANLEEQEILEAAGMRLDMAGLTVKTEKETHSLTVLEGKVLREFFLNPNKILSREHFLTKVWGLKASIQTRTVDNFIARIRKYIENNPSKPKLLQSIRGRGYKLNTKDDQKRL